MHELGSLLGRWHQWRRFWSHERGYARAALLSPPGRDDDLEDLQMQLVEQAYNDLPPDCQLAIQHIARAECMGVEVIHTARLGNEPTRRTLVAQAMTRMARALQDAGVL